MVVVRFILGQIILLINWLTTPRGIKRSEHVQTMVDQQTQQLALYQFNACPFCVKVRRAIKRLSLNIALCDAKNNDTCRQELLEGGGKVKVPCLRITNDDGSVQWMYESSDINSYLEQRFNTTD